MATPLDPALLSRQYQALDQARELGGSRLAMQPLQMQALQAEIESKRLAPQLRMLEMARQDRAQQATERFNEGRLSQMVQANQRPATPRAPQIVQTADGPMILNPDGTARPIMGAGGVPVRAPEKAEKPMTEFQGKAALYGTRMQNSHDILSAIEADTSQTGIAVKRGLQDTPVVGGILGAGANLFLSNNQQSIEQAQRDFINATLRQESGAVINPSEFENAQRQYFPQPGDAPALLSQKRKNREIAIAGFERMAGSEGGDAIKAIRESRGKAPTASPTAQQAGGWTQDKETRYQELLRKRGGS